MTHDGIRQPPTAFYLHALGGSACAFNLVISALGDTFEHVAIDLPGFGHAGVDSGTSVLDMAEHVIGIVRRRAAARWLLVGHSMGGKIASIVAARTLAGEAGLFGLGGVVLLAASPPTPEPMDEARRSAMVGWARSGSLDAAAARDFIDANVGAPLDASTDRDALHDLERASPGAWLAWLERGSREDWSQQVGTLDLPALIVAGGADGDLGPSAQRATNAVVYPRARVLVLGGAKHLLPLERPREVADAILHFWNHEAGVGPAVPAAYARLIASDRVGARQRAALAKRALSDHRPYTPRALTATQLATLRVVAALVVPQDEPGIDLAARLDTQLASGTGDGWRHADLPPDARAYALALDQLAGIVELTGAERNDWLVMVADGRFDQPPGATSADALPEPVATSLLSSAQMKRWFEDARADLVRLWLAHPATMARIGFDGFANGGDGVRKQGFERLGAGEREAWEPLQEAWR